MRAQVLIGLMGWCLVAMAGDDLAAVDAAREAAAGQVTLIDIRTPEEWRESGVPRGARRVDWRQGEAAFRARVLELANGDKTQPIALICRSGNRSTQAQRVLQEAGFSRVYNVREGMSGSAAGPGWIKQGLPLTACAADC